MSLTFDAATHAYRDDRGPLIGVSELLQDVGLSEDPAFFPEWAAPRGQVIHKACALATMGRLDWSTLHEDLHPFVKSWVALLEQVKPQVLAIEEPIWSQTLRMAGTPDMVLVVAGRPAIWDIKSGKAPKSTRYQLAAYDILLGPPARSRAAVELQENGDMAKLIPYDKPENRTDRDVVLAALSIYGAKRK